MVRRKLGYRDESTSYIHFLVLKLTGLNLNPRLVDTAVLVLFLLSFALSIWLNHRDRIARKKISQPKN
jgi:hypothetical protein